LIILRIAIDFKTYFVKVKIFDKVFNYYKSFFPEALFLFILDEN